MKPSPNWNIPYHNSRMLKEENCAAWLYTVQQEYGNVAMIEPYLFIQNLTALQSILLNGAFFVQMLLVKIKWREAKLDREETVVQSAKLTGTRRKNWGSEAIKFWEVTNKETIGFTQCASTSL